MSLEDGVREVRALSPSAEQLATSITGLGENYGALAGLVSTTETHLQTVVDLSERLQEELRVALQSSGQMLLLCEEYATRTQAAVEHAELLELNVTDKTKGIEYCPVRPTSHEIMEELSAIRRRFNTVEKDTVMADGMLHLAEREFTFLHLIQRALVSTTYVREETTKLKEKAESTAVPAHELAGQLALFKVIVQ